MADRQSDSEGEVPNRQQLEPTAEEIENAGMSADLMEKVCCDSLTPSRAMAEERALVVLPWSSEAGRNDGKGSRDLH